MSLAKTLKSPASSVASREARRVFSSKAGFGRQSSSRGVSSSLVIINFNFQPYFQPSHLKPSLKALDYSLVSSKTEQKSEKTEKYTDLPRGRDRGNQEEKLRGRLIRDYRAAANPQPGRSDCPINFNLQGRRKNSRWRQDHGYGCVISHSKSGFSRL